jgi:hypothetical protein
MSEQSEALRLADAIDPFTRKFLDNLTCKVAADELRRLHELNVDKTEIIASLSAMNQELLEALSAMLKDGQDYTATRDRARAVIAKVEVCA